jgi:hypothetical protein
MRTFLTPLLLALATSAAHAAANGGCETSTARKTPHGAVSRIECGNAKVGRQTTLLFDGVPVLSSADLYKEDGDDDLGYFVYSPEPDPRTACPDRLFLIDASARPVKVFAFGVQGACNQFEAAKWGRDRTVITLKKAVRFEFGHGVLTPPKAGSALWKSIEPPHSGSGLAEQEAIPFVQLVGPPRAASGPAT